MSFLPLQKYVKVYKYIHNVYFEIK